MRYTLVIISVLLLACSKQEVSISKTVVSDICFESAFKDGRVFYEGDSLYLIGSRSQDWKFDITGWSLNMCNISNGIGRENFPALIKPEYVSIGSEKGVYDTSERCIVMFTEGSPKIYPIILMRSHEVINDVNKGSPVVIVYCVLADFPAVYSRTFCGKELTFAPSGYTYHDINVDDDLRAFVLWDRETESLWWPLIDESVSGPMQGEAMNKKSPNVWKMSTWGEVEKVYPNAKVLKSRQSMPIPTNWPHFDEVCR